MKKHFIETECNMNSLKIKNICVVGFGVIGPFHARALKHTKNANFYAVCDNDPKKIAFCKQKYDVLAYSDFNEMLSDPMIDGVHICTPHYLHAGMIIAALNAGKSVIAEKPIAMTKAQFEQLLATEGINNVGLVFQNRLNPCIRKAKEMISDGHLGKLVCTRGIVTWNRTKEYYEADAWRGKWETEGGGVLINQSIHTLDLLHYLGGDFISVQASMSNFSLQDVIEVEDSVSAYFHYDNGATGIFFATNAYDSHKSPDIELVFENGTLRYTDEKLYLNQEVICEDVLSNEEKAYYGLGHDSLIRNFYENNEYFTILDAKNTMDTMYAMYESAKYGKVIFL